MNEESGSRSRQLWLGALHAAVATGLLSVNVSGVSAQSLPQAMPAEEAAPAAADLSAAEPAAPSMPAAPPVAPPPPPPAGPGAGPMVIPDGEAPPGPVAPAFPPAIPNIDFSGRLRVQLKMQDAKDPSKFGDVGAAMDADFFISGALTRIVKWQLGVTGTYAGGANSSFSAATATSPAVPRRVLGAATDMLDVMAKFEFMPEFNIYAGRMIVVADRYMPSGPWGMDEWYLPGIMPIAVAPALMRTGPVGRDLGVNVWGSFGGGLIKYYLGSYELHDPALSPLYSGRLQVSLLSGEPGFFQRTTYYGYKDLVAFGFGAQYQKEGSVQVVPPTTDPMTMAVTSPATLKLSNYSYFTGDFVVDKKLGDAGTVSFVASYAKFNGDAETWKSHYSVSLGYLIPGVVGIGKLRPAVRVQGVQARADGTEGSMIIDAQLGYVIMPWFARVALGYRNGSTDVGDGKGGSKPQKSNMIYLGITIADP